MADQATPLSPKPLQSTDPHVAGKKNTASFASPYWSVVTAYAAQARALPRSESALRTLLGMRGDASLDDSYSKLLTCYKALASQGDDWSDVGLKDLTKLAEELKGYGKGARLYFQPLQEIADRKFGKPGDKEEFRELVDSRAKKAKELAASADEVRKRLLSFQKSLEQQQEPLHAIDKELGGKIKSANDEIKKFSDAIADLDKKIKKATVDEETLKAIYKTADNPWLNVATQGVFSLVGLFHKKVLGGQDTIDHAESMIKEWEAASKKWDAKTREKNAVVVTLTAAKNSVDSISESLDKALPEVSRAVVGWTAIGQGLVTIRDLVDKDMHEIEPYVSKRQVAEAVDDWAEMGQRVDAFVGSLATTDQQLSKAA